METPFFSKIIKSAKVKISCLLDKNDCLVTSYLSETVQK